LRTRPAVGAAVFVILVLAAFATAAIVLYAKTPKLALEVPRLGTCPPGADQERPICRTLVPGRAGRSVVHIRFYVRYSDRHARVSIVGQGLDPARTLADDLPLQADRPVSFTWNGRTDGGAIAPDGNYALRVNLPDRGRNMLWVARRIRLETPRR
jgi:hypothetical protein